MSERRIFEKLPFDVIDYTENENKTNMFGSDLVLVGPKRYVEPAAYKQYGLDIYNFEARPDDVYLLGYPRSGTTLHCEMIWLIGNDLDYEGAAKDFADYRFPHIDFHLMRLLESPTEVFGDSEEALETGRKYQELTLKCLSGRHGKRFLKSHLPLSLTPPHIFEVGAKIIYCARNPKDVLISYYRATKGYKFCKPAPFKDWFHDFNKDLMWNCPYFEHLKEGWARRDDENFLFLFYEDTMKDKRRTIRKVANFLGKDISEDQINTLEDHLNIDKFKTNKAVNHDHLVKLGIFESNNQMIGKGKIGGWKELFDEDMIKEFDKVMEEKLKGTDIRFP